ncbi:unnamed protein product, partial [Iphiclides podalirius]
MRDGFYTGANSISRGMRYQDHIVHELLKIMEEGPEPMRDFQPAQKVKTGAEMFREVHRGYEACDSSIDRIQRVHGHNATYPQLRDELDKRRSTAKVYELTYDN